MRKTKIVATIGPASESVEKIRELFKAGLDACRINFSHGSYEEHSVKIDNVIKVREEMGLHIPLILDTKGPEIRTGIIKNGKAELVKGASFTLTVNDVEGDENIVSVTYKNLANELTEGAKILVDDGLIELKVKAINGADIICEVMNSGVLGSKKGINIPDVSINLPALTEKDIEDIKFGIEKGFDYIAASFVRSASDVMKIRSILDSLGGSDIQIISKIENREGVDNIDSIIAVTDGVMVARGDLGVEIPLEEVPIIQKELIEKCRLRGRTVITATQMLESMINNPRPTRAEANDVANAIFDGTDAIMLSGETAKGNFPVEAVETMVKIATKIESSIDYDKQFSELSMNFVNSITNAISHATCTTAMDLNAVCITAVSNTGYTVKKVSKYRPSCPILALTPIPRAARQLNLVWGCYPGILEKILSNVNDLFTAAANKSMEMGFSRIGDIIVIVGGTPVGITGATNTLKVQIVGDAMVSGKSFTEKIVSGKANIVKNPNDLKDPFNKGDILICRETDDNFLDIIKKASAIVVGNGRADEFAHAQTVSKTLDIPLIISERDVTELIPRGMIITVDAKLGVIYNGTK